MKKFTILPGSIENRQPAAEGGRVTEKIVLNKIWKGGLLGLERRVVWMEQCEDWWWLSGSLWEHVISPIWSLSLIWPPWQFDSWLRWELFLILTAEPRAAPGSIWEALEKLNKEFVVFVFLCSLSSLLNCPSHWKVSWKETPPDITICINRRHTNWAAFVKTFFTLLEATFVTRQLLWPTALHCAGDV